MSSKTKTIQPEQVQAEYRAGVDYKRQLGDRGMYEQNRINERFYSGDQWHGVALLKFCVVLGCKA